MQIISLMIMQKVEILVHIRKRLNTTATNSSLSSSSYPDISSEHSPCTNGQTSLATQICQ